MWEGPENRSGAVVGNSQTTPRSGDISETVCIPLKSGEVHMREENGSWIVSCALGATHEHRRPGYSLHFDRVGKRGISLELAGELKSRLLAENASPDPDFKAVLKEFASEHPEVVLGSSCRLNPDSLPREDQYFLLTTGNYVSRPSAARDRSTRLYSKQVLSSDSFLDQLEQAIPGPKQIVFFDFNNMSACNAFGLDKTVDEIIENIAGIARTSLRGDRYELIRVGGDEFALIMSDRGAQTTDSLNEFFDAIRVTRDHAFAQLRRSESARNVSQSERFARYRSLGRLRIEEYLTQCHEQHVPASLQGFRGFLDAQYSRCTIGTDNVLESLRRDIINQIEEMPLQYVPEEAQVKTPEVLGVTTAVVRLPERLTPEVMHIALAQTGKLVHQRKRDCTSSLSSVGFDPDSYVMRQADQELIDAIRSVEQLFEEAEQALANPTQKLEEPILSPLLLQAGRDPSFPEAFRSSSVSDRMLREILPASNLDAIFVTSFDINGFGIINDLLGYERADQLIRTAFSDLSEWGTLVRLSGGHFALLTGQPIPDEELAAMRRSIDHAVQFPKVASNVIQADLDRMPLLAPSEAVQIALMKHFVKIGVFEAVDASRNKGGRQQDLGAVEVYRSQGSIPVTAALRFSDLNELLLGEGLHAF